MSDVFCDDCVAASENRTPGNISTFNGIGRTFYGSADRCEKCGSIIKTLWFVLLYIPLLPLGSYRYKAEETGVISSRFRCRRTATNWSQVFLTWMIGWAVGIVGFYIIWRTRSP